MDILLEEVKEQGIVDIIMEYKHQLEHKEKMAPILEDLKEIKTFYFSNPLSNFFHMVNPHLRETNNLFICNFCHKTIFVHDDIFQTDCNCLALNPNFPLYRPSFAVFDNNVEYHSHPPLYVISFSNIRESVLDYLNNTSISNTINEIDIFTIASNLLLEDELP